MPYGKSNKTIQDEKASFKMRSGNKPAFKMMGSSPMKEDDMGISAAAKKGKDAAKVEKVVSASNSMGEHGTSSHVPDITSGGGKKFKDTKVGKELKSFGKALKGMLTKPKTHTTNTRTRVRTKYTPKGKR